jgi:hypothetical protein
MHQACTKFDKAEGMLDTGNSNKQFWAEKPEVAPSLAVDMMASSALAHVCVGSSIYDFFSYYMQYYPYFFFKAYPIDGAVKVAEHVD